MSHLSEECPNRSKTEQDVFRIHKDIFAAISTNENGNILSYVDEVVALFNKPDVTTLTTYLKKAKDSLSVEREKISNGSFSRAKFIHEWLNDIKENIQLWPC